MFYDNFVKLCNSINKSPSAAAIELGFKKSTVTRWKNGGMPTDANLFKIADYFGVSVEMLSRSENDKTPAPIEKGERQISDDDIMFALWGDSTEIDEEDLVDVKRYAEFVKQRKKGKQ